MKWKSDVERMRGNEMNKKVSPWTLKLTTLQLVLIPTAIGINYVGKLFAGMLKLPLWLDCIGTCLAACIGGPIVGALSGAINNLIYGVTVDPFALVYALTQIGIGIAVGYLSYKGLMQTLKGTLVTGVIAGFVAVVISTPLNIIFWGGQTGNAWGDAVFAIASEKGAPVYLASFFDEVFVDVPDKLVVLLIVFFILRALPQSIMNTFQTANKEIEEI